MNADDFRKLREVAVTLRGWVSIGGSILPAVLGFAGVGTACELPPLQDTTGPRVLYRVEAGSSAVRFDAKAFMHDFAGKTSRVQGVIRLADPDRLTEAEACIRIDAASLDTGIRTRDDIMRRDHLETAAFPAIDFLLKSLERITRQPGGWDFEAGGILSLHGIAREILLPVRVRQEGEQVRLTGQVPLRMSDYGIRNPRFLFFTVEDQVLVSFDVTATRAPDGRLLPSPPPLPLGGEEPGEGGSPRPRSEIRNW